MGFAIWGRAAQFAALMRLLSGIKASDAQEKDAPTFEERRKAGCQWFPTEIITEGKRPKHIESRSCRMRLLKSQRSIGVVDELRTYRRDLTSFSVKS